MSYSAKAIANYFIELGQKAGRPISPMKLQKLLYYAQGWCLAIAGESLINEQIEAWKWGPVVRSVYHEFKEFGNAPLTRLAATWRLHKENGRLAISRQEPHIEDDKDSPEKLEKLDFTRTLLNRIWEIYGQYTPVQLSNMTHVKGTPWDVIVTKHGGSPPKGTDIPQSLIKRHFNELAKQK